MNVKRSIGVRGARRHAVPGGRSRRLALVPRGPPSRRPRRTRMRWSAPAASAVAAADDRRSPGPAQAATRRRSVLALLGLAYAQEAAHTADPSYYAKAEEALGSALEPDANDEDAMLGMGVARAGTPRLRGGAPLGPSAPAGATPTTPRPTASSATRSSNSADTRAFATFDTMVRTRPDIASYARISYARELRGDRAGPSRDADGRAGGRHTRRPGVGRAPDRRPRLPRRSPGLADVRRTEPRRCPVVRARRRRSRTGRLGARRPSTRAIGGYRQAVAALAPARVRHRARRPVRDPADRPGRDAYALAKAEAALYAPTA